MKIRIESVTRDTRPAAYQVLWADGKKTLGGLSGTDAARQKQVDALLAAQAEKSVDLESDLFRDGENILVVSQLPKKRGLDREERVRLAAMTALESARARGVRQLTLVLDKASTAEVGAALEGLLYADYDFRPYKTTPGKRAAPEVAVRVKAGDRKAAEALLAETLVRFGHISNLRDWVNTPGSDLDPATFADIAAAQGKKHGLAVRVRDEKQLKKEGFLGLITVGKGSDRPPRMVTLEYKGPKSGKAKEHLVIVGKGVTFDTGGISLKPPAGMWEMKCDMAGAATALAAICAIAELKLPVRASAVICLAENRPGNGSVLPGDIFKAKNGKTVMVDNTDAEGRLVLSDGLFEAGTLGATHIINIATLTGAVVRALGPSMAGLFANDARFGAAIRKAGLSTGEKFWELPLEEEYREWMEDPVADLKNVTNKPEAGAITAGLFLSEFVPEGAKWSHWDVAGTAFVTSPWKYIRNGATGFGLKTLVQLARELH
jgi:leucyl aminopeptidase